MSAQKAYYEAHKEELRAKMRERDAQKRAIQREAREKDEEALRTQREGWRIKYARRGQKAVKAQIDEWLADPDVKEEFKAFLRTNVLPDDAYRSFTPKMLEALRDLPTLRQNGSKESPQSEVDGTSTRSTGSQAQEGVEEASEEAQSTVL